MLQPLPCRFDDSRRVVTVTDPRLPQPWINYLSNGDFHAFVSQSGGGLAWWKSPLKNRLTRYRQHNLPIDSPGFYVYIREADGTVWSPSWRPVETKLDAWRAEHQPGLTRFVARRGDLEATLELFIAPGANSLVCDVSIANRSGQPVHLDVFGYVELCLLDWKQDTDWACYVKHNLGSHGIPLTHKGDWNDSIGKFSKKGKGESLFAAATFPCPASPRL